jgi:hypothetical protein
MNITAFPVTSLGAAAAAVVSKVAASPAGSRIAAGMQAETFQPLPSIVWDGKPIAADGVYDLDISAYHSDVCVGPSISSSGLRTIDQESPGDYWLTSYLNPNAEPQKDSDAYILGRAAHYLLLGEGKLAEKFLIRPSHWDSWRTTAAKEWREAQIASGKTVLTDEHLNAVRGMAAKLGAHPLIQSGLLNGEIEKSLIWKDPETGIWLKARPDALPMNGDIIADIKTTTDIKAVAVRRTIQDYGYHMQLALVGMGMEHILGRTPGNDDYVLIFIKKSGTFGVNVKPIDIESIYWGRRQIRRALRKFADCLAREEWPDCEDDMSTASLSDWYKKNLEKEAQMGLLPEANAA